MTAIQLIESIPVETPLGPGTAVIFDPGEQDNAWTVILETGAFVTFPQQELKAARSYWPRRRLTNEDMKDILEQMRMGTLHD